MDNNQITANNTDSTNLSKAEEAKEVKPKMAKFPDWDVVPKNQFINPRLKKGD